MRRAWFGMALTVIQRESSLELPFPLRIDAAGSRQAYVDARPTSTTILSVRMCEISDGRVTM